MNLYTQNMDPKVVQPTIDWLSTLGGETVGHNTTPGNDPVFEFPSGYVQRMWNALINPAGSRVAPQWKWDQPIGSPEQLDAFMTRLFELCRAHVRSGRKWDYAKIMYRLYLNGQVQTNQTIESEDDMRTFLEGVLDEIEATWRTDVI